MLKCRTNELSWYIHGRNAVFPHITCGHLDVYSYCNFNDTMCNIVEEMLMASAL